MTDWDQLREVGQRVSPPAYESLVAVADRRSRRARAIGFGAALLVLLGAGVGLTTLGDGTARDIAPAEDPTGAILPESVVALPGPDTGSDHATLQAGRYRVPLDETLAFDFDVTTTSYAHDDGLFIASGGVVLKVVIADETYGVPANPCTAQLLQPAGPGVDDIARMMRSKSAYHATRPEPTELGGAKGTYLETKVPRSFDASRCSDGEVQSPGIPATSVGWATPARGRYWILDVGGQRVVVAQECSCSADEFDTAATIAQSITFTPSS